MRARRLAAWPRFSVLAGILLGCSADGAGPTGPATPQGAAYRLVALGADTLRGTAGDTVPGAKVLVLGAGDYPVRGVRVRWRVLDGGGRVLQPTTPTDANGIASATWVLGTDLTLPQILSSDIVSPDDRGPAGRGGDPVLLRASAGVPLGAQATATDTNRLVIDTIGAVLGSAVQLRLRLPDGRPIVGATIDFTVRRGGGRLSNSSAVTDSGGHAGTIWQLGDTAGAQEVAATVRPAAGQPTSQSLIRALSLPGTPTAIAPPGDTIRFDALGDRLQAVQLSDRAGNITYGQATWTSHTPAVVSSTEDGIFPIRDGTAMVTVHYGALSRTIPVVVSQVPASVVTDSAEIGLNWLGAHSRVRGGVRDRRDVPIPGATVDWSTGDSAVVVVDSQGVVRAVGAGATHLIASYQGVSTKVRVQVVQRPAAISVLPAIDTLELDSARTPTVVVLDSGGAAIPSPSLQVTQSDGSIIGVDPSGALRATLPGPTTLTYRAGTVSTSIDRVVEGTAILVSGQRVTAPATLSGLPAFTITNGRIRVSWSTSMGEIASVEMDVRLGDTWVPANARLNGDWVYVASTIRTMPTAIDLLEVATDRIALRMSFDNHWFRPDLQGFDPALGLISQPYPFKRTIWLRRADNGYYSWVDLINTLPYKAEHETGFGGIWGPATIRTASTEIRTDTLSKTVRYNGDPGLTVMGSKVDAAEFVLDGDPVRRLLVPLPEAPFITPVFSGVAYGSVYRYAGPPVSFGVYMYAGALGPGEPAASTICSDAWTNAPFPLHAVSPAELAGCGPVGP